MSDPEFATYRFSSNWQCPPREVHAVDVKTATALGLVPAANGEPGTVVSAPLLGSTANADTSLLRLLLTYKYFLSIVPAIAEGPRSAATGGPTENNAPLVASMENVEMLSAPEFATKENSPHTMLTSEISETLGGVLVKYGFCTMHRCAGDCGC